jgi:hypothetical protein
MAITATQSDASENSFVATGKSTDTAATPAVISAIVGFTPRVVEVINATTGTKYTWITGMAAASAHKAVNHADTQFSLITSLGITVSGGTITMPAPAQNDVVYWIAYR